MTYPRCLGATLTTSLRWLVLAAVTVAALVPVPARAVGAAPVPSREPAKVFAPTGRANFIVSGLDTLSGSAVEIFTLALAGKMDRVPKKFELLKKNAAAFDYLQDEGNSILLPRLGRTIADLDTAVQTKNRLDTMRYSNRITLIAATVAVPFKPVLPTEVLLLDYNGRELEIWSEVKKLDKLSNVVIRMHLAWQTLMPKLVEQNSLKELRRFSDLMGHLELAKTPEEYAKLSRQVLVEVESMKSFFSKPSPK
ncbi:hypothetical protein GMLC_40620 [Geomonas limicola]|uniref:Uncharacterized protein n=1 Tax=Geomonas limicola TaxID=2740186 RepID=A0A6V8NFV1_9BACT|nr:hypothetical protein [Geomonas limicola]GFO70483.1 hypothetical protein GMLC_40620 [Geomonas limicola]